MKGLRAYDVLMAATRTGGTLKWLAHFKDCVRGVPIFLIDDAHLCFYHTIDAKGGGVKHDEQIPATIPFPRFWMEYRPLGLDNEPQPVPLGFSFGRYGLLCEHAPKHSMLLVNLVACTITESGDSCAAMLAGFVLPFDEEGICKQHRLILTDQFRQQCELVGQPVHGGMIDGDVGTLLFALGLLSTKNVARRTEYVPRSLRRHPGTFGSSVRDSHYILDIPGVGELRSSLAGMNATQKRLHIVRGHFADYTEGGGLFGKLHGKYYIAPHVRGNAVLGTITKDYRVVAK